MSISPIRPSHFGAPCPPGCTCGKHYRKRKGRQTKLPQICRVPDCPEEAKIRWLCETHYHSWRRSGSFVLKNKMAVSKFPTMKPFRCMCGCRSTHHDIAGCLTENCKCLKLVQANESLWAERHRVINRLGFANHLNDTATCTRCFTPVRIGLWSDAQVLQRANEHAKRSCLKTKPVGVQRVLGTSPNRAG